MGVTPLNPDPTPAPGWAPNIGRASRHLDMLSSPALRLLVQPTILLWGPIVAWLIASTGSAHPHRERSGLGRAVMFLALLHALCWMGLFVGVTTGWLGVFLHVSGAALLSLWGLLLHNLTHPGTALRQRVRAFFLRWGAITWAAAALSFVLPDLIWALGEAGQDRLWYGLAAMGAAWALGLLAMAPRMWRLMRAFRTPCSPATAEDICEHLAARLGVPAELSANGLLAMGRRDGVEIVILYDEAHAPPRLFVELIDVRLPATLVIQRADAPGAGPGASLRDPLLRGVLNVQGLPAPLCDAMLGGAHEDAMPLFHGCDQALLVDQLLRFSREAIFETPEDAVEQIGQLLDSALRLMARIRTVHDASSTATAAATAAAAQPHAQGLPWFKP